ncbi:MAG: hypothetical protein ACOYOJ_13160 [Alsobacter sp.]
MTFIGHYFTGKNNKDHNSVSLKKSDYKNEINKIEDSVKYLTAPNSKLDSPENEITSIMDALKEQALSLKCEQNKFISDWQIAVDLLAGRVSKIHPLLAKNMEAFADREREIVRVSASEAELSRRLLDAERDLSHYRPTAVRLEDELHRARNLLSDSQKRVEDLEAEREKSQRAFSDLANKAASDVAARQRLMEESATYLQKLQDHDTSLKALLRESSHMKSELVSRTSDAERLEAELGNLTKKLTTEFDEHSRSKGMVDTLRAQLAQARLDAITTVNDAEERERRALEMAASHEKQCHDLEIRQTALLSKIDFLERLNTRHRDELRRQLDQIGNLDASNRSLLDALSRHNNTEENIHDDSKNISAKSVKLHAVNENR